MDPLAVRELGPGRIADYTTNGNFADSVPNGDDFDHLTDGWDPGNYLTWNSVTADSSGQITLVVSEVIGFGYISGTRIRSNAIPEPGSLVLIGFLGVCCLTRKRR